MSRITADWSLRSVSSKAGKQSLPHTKSQHWASCISTKHACVTMMSASGGCEDQNDRPVQYVGHASCMHSLQLQAAQLQGKGLLGA